MWLIFALLSLVAAAFVVYPLFSRSSRQQPADPVHANVVLFQEQLADLDRQLADEEIDAAQHAELVAEQQRLLLADENLTVSQRQAHGRGAWLILAGLLIVPVFTFTLYEMLGASDDVAITTMMQDRLRDNLDQAEDAQLRERLTQRIGRRLMSQPDNIYYLVSLARLQLESGDMLQASASYQKAVEVSPDDPDLLAEYAQAMYFASGNKFVPSAENALDRALLLAPNNLTALGLQGIRAFENADYALAIASWQSALRAISPATPQAQALQAGIARAKQQLGEELPGIQVQVTLSPELVADPELLVYVFAREWQGPPMPLAVTRLQVADLPATVVLDDTMAMPGGEPLSSVEQVQVVARVSQSGSAIPAPGDLEGASGALSISQGSVSEAVIIDRKL